MPADKLRRRIAWEAARLMYDRQESEYYRAKLKAARRFCRGWVKPQDLPTNSEIRDQIQSLARMHEGDRRTENLREMRIEALRVMRLLRAFRPRLIGSTLTGHVRHGSDIDLHVFSDSLEAVAGALRPRGWCSTSSASGSASMAKSGFLRTSTFRIAFRFELTIYAASLASHVFISSVTGKPIERASIAELEAVTARASIRT